MLTNKALKEDASKLHKKILDLEANLAQGKQQINQMEIQLMRLNGALAYINDNLRKEAEKCSEKT